MNEVLHDESTKHLHLRSQQDNDYSYLENVFPVVEREVSLRAKRFRLQTQDVEDLAQNAHLNLLRSAQDKLKNLADPELRSYVFIATRNVFRDFFRRKTRNKYFESSLNTSDIVSGYKTEGNTQTEVRSLMFAYWECIAKLPLQQKFVYLFAKEGEILFCLFDNGYTMDEVAEQLNLSVESWFEVWEDYLNLIKDPHRHRLMYKELGIMFERLYLIKMNESQVADYRRKALNKLNNLAKQLNSSQK